MIKYAIIGYHNTLAKNILKLLDGRGSDIGEVAVFDAKVQGEPKVSYGESGELTVHAIEDLSTAEAVIFTSHDNLAARYAVKFASAGAKVINATNALEGESDIPMIVGGVNDNALEQAAKGIVNVPNPLVTMLLGGVAELAVKYQIKSVRATALVAADIEGQDGMSELYNSTRRILMNDITGNADGLFHKTLAFNVIPQVSSFIGEETFTEWAFNSQIKQVLGGDVKVHVNAALIPSFVGAGIYADIETFADIDAGEVEEDIKKTKGVLVINRQEDGGYASLTDVQGESSIFVSRIRQDMTVENGISLWLAGDYWQVAAQNILAVLKQFLKRK